MTARTIVWRQGHLVTPESLAQLSLELSSTALTHAVVITHDCDLANPSEPWVELIACEIKDKPDGQFSHAKHPRRLQLSYEVTIPQDNAQAAAAGSGNEVPPIQLTERSTLLLELQRANRFQVCKEHFSKHARPDTSAHLPAREKQALKQWLAARYARPAFPDTFEAYLRKNVKAKLTVEKKIAKILEPAAGHLIGMFFDLGAFRDEDPPKGIPYEITIAIVYDATEGGPESRHEAERVAQELTQLFGEVYGSPEQAQEIALLDCQAISDTEYTLADLRRSDQWRLEYISLRDDDNGGYLPVGKIPG